MTGHEEGRVSEQERGGRLQSGRSVISSFVRFVNRTQRHVDIVWLNYEGARVRYKTLQPAQFVDVNTFVGHPWIFRDAETGDHLVVQLNEIFEATTGWDPSNRALPKRRVVNITLPVYSLKTRSLQVLRNLVHRDRVTELDLPASLKVELQEMIDVYCRRHNTISTNAVAGPSSHQMQS